MDSRPRMIGTRVDIGADVFTWTADVNDDGYVDVVDLLMTPHPRGRFAAPRGIKFPISQ